MCMNSPFLWAPLRAPAALPALLLAAAFAVRGATSLSLHNSRSAVHQDFPSPDSTGPGLSLAQVFAQSTRTHGPWAAPAGGATREVVHHELHDVVMNFEIEDLDTSKGVTVLFSKGDGAMRVDPGYSPTDGLAWGHYNDNIEVSGWSQLYMQMSESEAMSNSAKMYAAGFAEGLLTSIRMSEYYANTMRMLLMKGSAAQNIKDVIEKQLDFLRMKTNLETHVMSKEPTDPYWMHARYMLAQLWGVCDGYNVVARHFGVHMLGLEDLALLNMGGELPQLIEAYGGGGASFLQMMQTRRSGHNQSAVTKPAEDPLDDRHWERRVAETGRCSAFVKVAEGNKDLLVGHTTWGDYSSMIRIFKYYRFPLTGADTMSTSIAMSSYPGVISSTDDFFAMSNDMVVMETSIEVLDPEVNARMPYFPARPRIPGFVHLMATNRLAKNARHWAKLYTESANNLAYSAQWMIVDYNMYKPNVQLPNDVLWLVEVLPGMSMIGDVSQTLRTQGYWASYNRPYFDIIREASGHSTAQTSHGDLYSWDKNPRAKIFEKEAGDTNSLFDMRNLMTKNTFPSTGVKPPLPAGPGHDISARMDLDAVQPIPNGGIDAKVLNRCSLKKMQVQAQSGPSHSSVPAFKWALPGGVELFKGWPHIGQPNLWNFEFVQMMPTGLGALNDGGDC